MWIFDNDTSATMIFYQSTIVLFAADAINLGRALCGLALLVSFIQTMWSFTRLDRILRWLFSVYTNGEFAATSISLIDQVPSTTPCYQFNRRFSRIPCPHRLILIIVSMQIYIIDSLMISTLISRKSYEIHGCEDYNTYPQPDLTFYCYINPCSVINNLSVSTEYQR